MALSLYKKLILFVLCFSAGFAKTLVFAKEISISHQHEVHHEHHENSDHAEDSGHSHCEEHPADCHDHKNHKHTMCSFSCATVWHSYKSDLRINLTKNEVSYPLLQNKIFESSFKASIFRPPI